jgi:hypothetical protein
MQIYIFIPNYCWDSSPKDWTLNTENMKVDAKVRGSGNKTNSTGNKCIHCPLGIPRRGGGLFIWQLVGRFTMSKLPLTVLPIVLSTRSRCHYSHSWFIIISVNSQSGTNTCPRPVAPCDAFGFGPSTIETPSATTLGHAYANGVGRLWPSPTTEAPLPCKTRKKKFEWIG